MSDNKNLLGLCILLAAIIMAGSIVYTSINRPGKYVIYSGSISSVTEGMIKINEYTGINHIVTRNTDFK